MYNPQKSINFDPINFGREQENGLLTPAKFYKRLPVEYTVTCGCKKCCNGRRKCRRLEAESFVPVVTPVATVVGCDFILILL